jgi:hypothetical protein
MDIIKNTLYVSMIIFIASNSIFSQTIVSGTIIGTWTAANSPYIVSGNILVASLVIEPGVVIRFSGDYVFEVAGTLRCQGTEQNPILFTRDGPNIRWEGIYANSAQSMELSYCRIEWSRNSGIRIKSTSPIIRFCRIIYNYAIAEGAPSSGGKGGGVHVESGQALLTNCVIDSNLVDAASYYDRGGAVCVTGTGAVVTLKNSIIAHNEVSTYPGHAEGGGIYLEANGTANVENCVITGTYVNAPGVVTGGGIFIDYPSQVKIINSIIFNNGKNSFANSFIADTSQVQVSYSCVEFGYTGAGNISTNPLFADGQFNLIEGISPCIDKGNPDTVYNDPIDQNAIGSALHPALGGIRNDIGAYGGHASFRMPYIQSNTTSVNSQVDILPSTFSLSQNYPNPFNPATTIKFSLSMSENVRLTVFDCLGREVTTLVNQRLDAGEHVIHFRGDRLASGLYFYKLESSRYSSVKKMALLK